MKRLQINSAEIFLENYKEGQGKIIVSDLNQGSWSYYWGSMGDTIEKFICDINSDYFAGKLCNESRVFSGEKTAREIRRYIREDLKHDLPWYKFMGSQKQLRELIKEIEGCNSNQEAIDIIGSFHKNIMCYDLDKYDEKEFLGIIESNFSSEPWHFLQTEQSREYKYLVNLHNNLKKELSIGNIHKPINH